MVGAAVGGGGSLLSGKSLGKSLKNAAIGGTLGYGGGALLGSAGAGAATTAGTTASTGASLAPEVGGGILSDIGGLSSISQGGSAMGALDSAALAEGTTGLTNSLIPTMDLANSTGALSPSMLDTLKQYGTIDNLTGAAKMASMYQPTPLQAAPSGSIKVGQAPTGDIYDELRKYGYTLPKRRETNFSLLG
jgi:hypothetical protein